VPGVPIAEVGHRRGVRTGSIYSYVITHHPQVASFDYPLPIVLVELEEGVRMVMNTVPNDDPGDDLDVGLGDVTIGADVTVSIRQADGERKLPFATVTGTPS
jgi:uncharacterized OB-fold protein